MHLQRENMGIEIPCIYREKTWALKYHAFTERKHGQ
jgi:hypothetical protein